jgi:predicted Na+-dependent transporter
VSNVAAFFMMPLLLMLYGPAFTNDDIEIPFTQIILGLLVTLIPVGIGMTVLAKRPNVAKKLEKGASILGALFIAAAIVAGISSNQDLFTSGYKLYVASVFMVPIGALCGYGLSAAAKLPHKQRRTVALETGIQNSTLTIAIITLSFPRGTDAETKLQDDVLAFALMYV